MANRVFANSRGVAHKGSGGKSIAAFPDVCKTPAAPAPPVPIPYPHIQVANDAEKSVKKVKIKAKAVMTKGAKYSTSSGDEPGRQKGVISHKNMGKAHFVNHSMDVKVQGNQVVRHLDMTTHNHVGNPAPPFPNVNAGANANPAAAAADILEEIEKALAAYQRELKNAPRLSFQRAQQIQKQYEDKFKQLLTQLKAAAANIPELRMEVAETERLVAAALAGKGR